MFCGCGCVLETFNKIVICEYGELPTTCVRSHRNFKNFVSILFLLPLRICRCGFLHPGPCVQVCRCVNMCQTESIQTSAKLLLSKSYTKFRKTLKRLRRNTNIVYVHRNEVAEKWWIRLGNCFPAHVGMHIRMQEICFGPKLVIFISQSLLFRLCSTPKYVRRKLSALKWIINQFAHIFFRALRTKSLLNALDQMCSQPFPLYV